MLCYLGDDSDGHEPDSYYLELSDGTGQKKRLCLSLAGVPRVQSLWSFFFFFVWTVCPLAG